MKRHLAVLLATVCACRNAEQPRDAHEILAERFRAIRHLAESAEPDDVVAMISIATATYPWRDGLLDLESDHQTRCDALRKFWRSVGLFPLTHKQGQYLHGQAQRYADRLAHVEIYVELESLVDQPPVCGDIDPPRSVVEMLGVFCPMPALRPWFAHEHMEHAVTAIDRLTSWRASEAVRQIDSAVAVGDADAFHQMLVEYMALGPADRAEASETVTLAFDWLGRLADQDGPRLQAIRQSIATGELGAALDEVLADPDPDVRNHALRILIDTPRQASRQKLERLESSDPDSGVRASARDALSGIDGEGHHVSAGRTTSGEERRDQLVGGTGVALVVELARVVVDLEVEQHGVRAGVRR